MGLIAVEGLQIISSAIHPSGNVTIQTQPSNYCKVDGKKIYRGDIDVIVPSGSVQSGATLINPLTITIKPQTINNTLVDGLKPISQGDTATKEGEFQIGSGTTFLPVTLTVTNAGQSEVDAT